MRPSAFCLASPGPYPPPLSSSAPAYCCSPTSPATHAVRGPAPPPSRFCTHTHCPCLPRCRTPPPRPPPPAGARARPAGRPGARPQRLRGAAGRGAAHKPGQRQGGTAGGRTTTPVPTPGPAHVRSRTRGTHTRTRACLRMHARCLSNSSQGAPTKSSRAAQSSRPAPPSPASLSRPHTHPWPPNDPPTHTPCRSRSSWCCGTALGDAAPSTQTTSCRPGRGWVASSRGEGEGERMGGWGEGEPRARGGGGALRQVWVVMVVLCRARTHASTNAGPRLTGDGWCGARPTGRLPFWPVLAPPPVYLPCPAHRAGPTHTSPHPGLPYSPSSPPPPTPHTHHTTHRCQEFAGGPEGQALAAACASEFAGLRRAMVHHLLLLRSFELIPNDCVIRCGAGGR